MANNLLTDYFADEAAIVARLKAEVPELKKVYTPFSLADMVESSQDAPAAHVIYSGDNVRQNEVGQGTSRMIGQKWMVVLVVRSAKAQLQNTSEIRSEAGTLIPKILKCLQGYKPTEISRPLSRIAGAPPPGYSSSFAYFPFMFESIIVT